MPNESDHESEPKPEPTPGVRGDDSAVGADATETSIMEPVDAGDTQVIPPVPSEHAADAAVTLGADGHIADGPTADGDNADGHIADRDNAVADSDAGTGDDASAQGSVATSSSRRNALGVWGVVSGALLLFPIALVLGHMGLRANRNGDANNKSVALAGVILGYLGLAAALVGTAIALFVVWPNVDAQNTDNAAKADVINIGNAMVVVTVGGSDIPAVQQLGSAWSVGDQSVPMQLRTEQTVTVTGDGPAGWCVTLSYQGGNESDVSYSPTGGLTESANCG